MCLDMLMFTTSFEIKYWQTLTKFLSFMKTKYKMVNIPLFSGNYIHITTDHIGLYIYFSYFVCSFSLSLIYNNYKLRVVLYDFKILNSFIFGLQRILNKYKNHI